MDPRDREFSPTASIVSTGDGEAKIVHEGEIEALNIIRSIQFDVPNNDGPLGIPNSPGDDGSW